LSARGLETSDEGRVFGRGNSLLKHRHDLGDVAPNQSRWVEPETGKDFAAVMAGFGQRQTIESPFTEHKPINGCIPDSPDNVFADAVPLIRAELFVQIIAGSAASDFGDQFRRPGDKAVFTSRLPTAPR
jgi:hypothetical protein